ncbi:MAG TPA: hypothetical protein VNR40_01960 [Steroidobacter sp.]|nr:hypothetical protein [Steroidobacter sp.]
MGWSSCFPLAFAIHPCRCPITSQWLVRWLPAEHRIRHDRVTGDIYSGLWYPVIACVMTVIVGTFFLRETHGNEAV